MPPKTKTDKFDTKFEHNERAILSHLESLNKHYDALSRPVSLLIRRKLFLALYSSGVWSVVHMKVDAIIHLSYEARAPMTTTYSSKAESGIISNIWSRFLN